jgi:hypothetical protein
MRKNVTNAIDGLLELNDDAPPYIAKPNGFSPKLCDKLKHNDEISTFLQTIKFHKIPNLPFKI